MDWVLLDNIKELLVILLDMITARQLPFFKMSLHITKKS